MEGVLMKMSSLNKNGIWTYGFIYWSCFLFCLACEDENPSATMDTESSPNEVMNEVSDQIVEATHSALNKRLEASKYVIEDVESKKHGEMLFRGIVHFNSYNV